MIKFPLAAALLVAAVAAPAAAKDTTSFTVDGVTYAYTTTKAGQSTIIDGYASTGADFRYVVRKGEVVGNNNGIPVRFSVADAMAAKPLVTIVSER